MPDNSTMTASEELAAHGATARPGMSWQLARGRHVEIGARTWVCAILNLTPDSFYVDSRLGASLQESETVANAIAAADTALHQGAEVLDLGAESTRPGASPLSPAEEQQRLLPALRAIRERFPKSILSVDTRHAGTAELALRAGADIINDVTGLSEPAMAALVARTGCGLIAMHHRGDFATMHQLPPLADPVATVTAGFEAIFVRAAAAGVRPAQMVLDPGFGFGKNLNENLPLLTGFKSWQHFGRPLLAGLSRKRFIGHLLGDLPAEERLYGTVAANTVCIMHGARLIRVHDVEAGRAAAAVAEAALANAKG